MTEVVLRQIEASRLKLGDIVARSSGQITSLEFCPIHELRTYVDGRVHIIQKTKNGITLNGDSKVWIVVKQEK